MSSNKRIRFRAASYARRVEYLAVEMGQWRDVYERRARDAETSWLANVLLTRAHECDLALHDLLSVEKHLWGVVQQPLRTGVEPSLEPRQQPTPLGERSPRWREQPLAGFD